MSTLHKFILWLLLSTVNVGEANKDVTKTSTDVVDLSLSSVDTYAELKHDPSASLPDSFTVCSTIMPTGCEYPHWPRFFNILNENNGHFLVPFLVQGDTESTFAISLKCCLSLLFLNLKSIQSDCCRKVCFTLPLLKSKTTRVNTLSLFKRASHLPPLAKHH